MSKDKVPSDEAINWCLLAREFLRRADAYESLLRKSKILARYVMDEHPDDVPVPQITELREAAWEILRQP